MKQATQSPATTPQPESIYQRWLNLLALLSNHFQHCPASTTVKLEHRVCSLLKSSHDFWMVNLLQLSKMYLAAMWGCQSAELPTAA